MDLLFIHGNYPAQFRHLPRLGQSGEHRVVFLTADAESDALPGAEIRKFSCHRRPSSEAHHYLTPRKRQCCGPSSATRTKSAHGNRLLATGGKSCGNGLALFIKDLLPTTSMWVFLFQTLHHSKPIIHLRSRRPTQNRPSQLLTPQELECCDLGVVPTEWQKSQFPSPHKDKLTVIFDGIDTNFFQPFHDPLNLKIKTSN